MGKILVIAEKPSAAADMAKVLGGGQKKNGFIENENYVITWALGHLVGLKNPEEHDSDLKAWKLDALPLVFDIQDSLKILDDTKSQFKVIKELIHRADVDSIINAGDAGREGYLIQEWIYRMAGNRKPKKVLWSSSLTEQALRTAFAHPKDPKYFDSLLLEAEARAEGDFLLGINYSRALTLTKSNGPVLRYGRCQTPVLNLIVNRDLEIENFKPEAYYNVEATFAIGSGHKGILVDTEKKRQDLKTPDVADEILHNITGQPAYVKELKTERKNSQAPLLFDLTTLQKTMNTQHGYDPKETLQIAQSLYEKHKILSYPRTDSRYLSQDVYDEVKDHLESCNFGIYSPFLARVDMTSLTAKKRYFNDLKVSDHHALIPTINEKTKDIYDTLEERERNVFDVIVRSLIAIFYPDYIYDSTNLLTGVKEYDFLTKGTTIIQQGWKDVLRLTDENEKAEDVLIPVVAEGDNGTVSDCKRLNQMTKAPSHYTGNSILAAMEKYNIGTPATRAEILEKLQNPKSQYITIEKKNYIATELGRAFIQVVPDTLKNTDLTAQFEAKLKQIEEGKLTKGVFLQEMKEELNKRIELFKENTGREKIARNESSLGICPCCKKGQILENSKAYGCNQYKEGCKFVIWKVIAGKKITENMAAQLLEKGKTGLIKGFKSKKGTSFDARLVLNKDFETEFEFSKKR